MTNKELATILYVMSLGLDYADGIEYADDEIADIESDMNNINDSTRQALESIAEDNKNVMEWYNRMINKRREDDSF